MNEETKHYTIIDEEGEFRFASELSHYQPIDFPRWQPFYFQYFFDGSRAKELLPFVLEIQRHDLIQEITIIRFIFINDVSSDFFPDHDHLILLALVELSTKEKVLMSCF